MAKHAEHKLGKTLSTCVLEDKVLLMCNPQNFIPFALGI
jgi:hypothetical protein